MKAIGTHVIGELAIQLYPEISRAMALEVQSPVIKRRLGGQAKAASKETSPTNKLNSDSEKDSFDDGQSEDSTKMGRGPLIIPEVRPNYLEELRDEREYFQK